MHGSDSTQESENGTAELSVTCNSNEVYQISLGTGSYTLTVQTLSFLKDWPGYLNPPLLQSVLVRLCDLARQYPGHKFSFKYMTRSSFRSQYLDVTHQVLRRFVELSELKSRIKTP